MLNNKPCDRQAETGFEESGISSILSSLANKSQATLEHILDDPQVCAAQRVDIALKSLQIAAFKDKSNHVKIIGNNNQLPLALKNSERAKVASLPTSNHSQSQIDSKRTNDSQVPTTQLFPAHYWQIDNFLCEQDYQQILDTALNKRSEFYDSRTITNSENYRQSLILPGKQFPEVYYLFKRKLLETLPSALIHLHHPEFSVAHIEMQMTAHGNGCFYKAHTDAGSEKTKTRELTYVYYFYQEPKQFSGGQLKLYDTERQGKKVTQKETSETIEPRNNSIVFFNSRCRHEVLPIASSCEFSVSRFTINGWLRR